MLLTKFYGISPEDLNDKVEVGANFPGILYAVSKSEGGTAPLAIPTF